jgi:hypothetical protein
MAVAAAKADAPDSPVNIALTAGSDEASAAQSPLNSRRSNSCLFISFIFTTRLPSMLHVEQTWRRTMEPARMTQIPSPVMCALCVVRWLGPTGRNITAFSLRDRYRRSSDNDE